MIYRTLLTFYNAWISPFFNHVHFEKIVGLTADDGMLFGASTVVGSTLRTDTDIAELKPSLSHHTKRAKIPY